MSFPSISCLFVIGLLALDKHCVLGENIVEELNNRYYDTSNVCFDSQNVTQAAYKCSGLIIRGVRDYKNELKFGWSLKPADKARNSFSMAYLRVDHPITILGNGYDAGYILYPHLKTPRHKNRLKVLCAFPVDARTDNRTSRGCGEHKDDENGISRPCNVQNITTFTQWLTHYDEINSDFEKKQCGFDMTKETEVHNFGLAFQAHKFLQETRFASFNNELKVEGWDEDNAKVIPIQAFFYFIDSENGLENAVKYRNDFYALSGGEKIPIVGILLPNEKHNHIYITQ